MARPLAQRMIASGSYDVRVLSLCEFRGIETPENPLAEPGIPVVRLSKVLRPPAVKDTIRAAKPSNWLSRAAREFAWRGLLEGNLNEALKTPPDLVILFNDAAYPYDRVTRVLRTRGIRFLLIQEGIRFEATESAVDGALNQGRGGAAAIAVFGQSSAEFFRKQGAPADSIHLTGNPRFDQLKSMDLRSEESRIRRELKLGSRNLLFLSNPIEFHGYCTAESKLALVSDFVRDIEDLFEDKDFRLIFKLHGNENPDDFLAASRVSGHFSQIVMASQFHLYPLLKIVDGAIIFGTTAGLEALLFGVPLGVLEIPGIGYLHDYVREGAATGLRWTATMSQQVSELMESKGRFSPNVEKYLARSLASRNDATSRVLAVVESLISGASVGRSEPCTLAS
jgi:hypothetical protein